MSEPLPRAAEPFVRFTAALRTHGFSVAPEQTEAFIAGVGLLGPRAIGDIYRAAVPTLAPPPERRDAFRCTVSPRLPRPDPRVSGRLR